MRYRINGDIEDNKRGNVLNVDAAYGIRPWKLEYNQPDTVFLVEVIGEWAGKSSFEDIPNPDSGNKIISVAPGVLFSYRNIMLKGGVKFPVIQDLNGLQMKRGPEVVFALDIHMPPFK